MARFDAEGRYDSIPHGTATGYGHYKCRCDLCRASHADRIKTYLAKRRREQGIAERPNAQGKTGKPILALLRKHPDWQPDHGTRGRYNRGCRCENCRAFNSERCRRTRAKRRAAAP